MAEPKNTRLYKKVKKEIDEDLKKKGKRWSAYASGRLVREYKRRGGEYIGNKSSKKGISRWFNEKWIDVCYWPKKVECGRDEYSIKKYPYCRPSVKVTKNTPKTVQELSPKERKELCKDKRKNPKHVLRFCGQPSNQKYKIKKYTHEQAKKHGFKVIPSDSKTKKIDVYKNGGFIASVGGKNCNDYPTYMEMERKGLVPKGTANKKRKNYKKRHDGNRKHKYVNGKISRGWLADKLLW